jgi:hypothetical protein
MPHRLARATQRVVLAFGIVVLAEVVVAFGRVELAAHLIDILGVLIGEGWVGANRIVEVRKLTLCLGVVRILCDHGFEKRAGFGIFADLTVLHRERDAGIA